MNRILGGLGVLVLLASLPVAARASHPSQICLEVDPENYYAVQGDDIIDEMRAYVGFTDAGHPPEQDGCDFDRPVEGGATVHFEIEGASDPDGSYSPESPDLECTIPDGGNICRIYPPTGHGEQTITAWIDLDPESVQLDPDEGPNEAEEPGGPEPDTTDIVPWIWQDQEHYDRRNATNVTLGYRARSRRFHGVVASSRSRCILNRRVVVFEAREGRDRLVGRARADRRGAWHRAVQKKQHGRFYAEAPRAVFPDGNYTYCLPDRSRVLRVP